MSKAICTNNQCVKKDSCLRYHLQNDISKKDFYTVIITQGKCKNCPVYIKRENSNHVKK